jgi:hypothetical protein
VGATGDGGRGGEVDADGDLGRPARRAAQVREFDRDRVVGVLESDPDVRGRLVGDGGDFEVGVVGPEFEPDRVGLGGGVVEDERHRSAGTGHRPVDQEVGPVVLVLGGIGPGRRGRGRRDSGGE